MLLLAVIEKAIHIQQAHHTRTLRSYRNLLLHTQTSLIYQSLEQRSLVL
jgi:hypothetical protein